MKVENKDFWENESVISTQDRVKPTSSDYEVYLYNKVAEYLKGNQNMKAQVLGCGTGREIPEIIKYVGVDKVTAIDISENMIAKCITNLQNWGIYSQVEATVQDATIFASKCDYDVVTIMNNMLTYVINKQDRYAVFKNSHESLKQNGCIIGVVHNQVGVPQKSLYFVIRNIFSFFLKNEPGYRLTGFKGMRFGGYYFTKNILHKHLEDNGFKNIEILALSDYYKNKDYKYNRWKGYNNLIFFATKN